MKKANQKIDSHQILQMFSSVHSVSCLYFQIIDVNYALRIEITTRTLLVHIDSVCRMYALLTWL